MVNEYVHYPKIVVLKGDFTLDGMKAECRRDIAFFALAHA